MSVNLTDEQLEKILPVLRTFPEIRLGLPRQIRRFLEAVLWMTRTGAQWRNLPQEYGNWNTVYKRFARWSKLGVFEKLFEHLSSDRDLEYLLIDSIIIRAHACSAGAQKKEGEQSLGRSRGGHSTKIHLACDALGNAIRFILTGGERNDITQAEQLIESLFPDYVIADKAYDADNFILLLQKKDIEVVIPSKINRKIQRVIDTDLYKERHLIECCIGKLKHFRRVFSRFDKLAKNYLSFVQFADTLIWLR